MLKLRAYGQVESIERVGYGPGQAVPAGKCLPERIPGADTGYPAGIDRRGVRRGKLNGGNKIKNRASEL